MEGVKKEKISGIPREIVVIRTFFDENWIKHIVEERYEYIDHLEGGSDLVIRYRLRESKAPSVPSK